VFARHKKLDLPTAAEALPGRETAIPVPELHTVFGTSLTGPWPAGAQVAVFGMGCFWGAERLFWRLPGVISTSVGYAGGITPNPTYEEVCSGLTGHAEVVRVVYDPMVPGRAWRQTPPSRNYRPARISYGQLLKVFWENHDPTQGMRQGADVGTQYRSAIYTSSDEQLAQARSSRDAFAPVVRKAGRGEITTEIRPLDAFYLAEEYHQQYLSDAKNPNGYCTHGPTGMTCPIGFANTGT
jgi:peptide-methionine (S)-S-oxide reductase